ncbi:MAG: FAD synthetase family protein [Bacteroidales bacterium]|jgi:riboflavin kinase/FMN adenylyltransferase|nr:FAD synthetase family protein [Bacteroidales bacterium]
MKIHYSFDDFEEIKNPVVTTGIFDGVHIGHSYIISRLNELADQVDGESVLITFHPHPRKILLPEKVAELKLINSQKEKKIMLSTTKLDHLFVIEFTKEFSEITSEKFVTDILLNKLKAKVIVVGFNHHFGHNREGDYEYLYNLSKKRNFIVEEIPQQDIENETVSSTRIRKAILEGQIMRANAYLNHQYFIHGNLYNTGQNQENELKYIIELDEKEKLLPPAGRYAAKIKQNGQIFSCISEIIETSGKPKVFVIEVENFTFNPNKPVNLYFFKRLRFFDEDPENFIKTRETDKNNVKRLIY